MVARGRKFTNARDLLDDLIDRHEEGVAQPVGYPDYSGFADINACDSFSRSIELAERSGAILRVQDSGRRRGELKFVRLVDAAQLYKHLGRTPSRQTALTAADAMLRGLIIHPAIREVALLAVEAWTRNRKWFHLGVEDAASMRSAIRLAQAFVEQQHLGMDYRTFSRRVVADSKALERLESVVLQLVGAAIDLPQASSPRATFAALGLERFSPPLLLSGRFMLDGASVAPSLSYLGIPPHAIESVGFDRWPDYVLTIENFASFNRHVLEADPGGQGLTLYVGGYPSLAAQKALAELAARLPEIVPFFHWSDIDPDGTLIFRTIERALGRQLWPHLMSRDLAESFGEAAMGRTKLRIADASGSMIADVVDYLMQPDAKFMEQEQIDPEIPSRR